MSGNPVLQRNCGGRRTNDDDGKKTIIHRSAVIGVPTWYSSTVNERYDEHAQPPEAGTRPVRDARFGYDFSGVRVYGDGQTAMPAHSMGAMAGGWTPNRALIGPEPDKISDPPNAVSGSLHIDGSPAIDSLQELDEIYIDGKDDEKKGPAPAPKDTSPGPTPPSKDLPKKEASTCPTNIKVAEVRTQSVDANLAESGTKTGLGGYAAMEVSGPGRKTWDGTAIHENLKRVKNSCEAPGACSNANGKGGASGSTFKVGEKSNFLGMRSLSAKKNTFYDLHAMAMKDSWLHKSRKSSCEVQCQQQYDCDGTLFGPTFLITYSFTLDTVNSDRHSFYVTQIGLKKEAGK